MMWKKCRQGALGSLGVAGIWLLLAGVGTAADGNRNPLPKFDRVEKAFRDYFQKELPGYRSGEVLSRSQVEPLFKALDGIGWRVAARRAIVEAVLPDNDPLVRRLRTRAGKKFARQLAGVPQGYDRIDHLRHLPAGLKRVDNLIQGPDGYLLIKYMTTTKEGKTMSQMLSNNPGGKNFDKPTGRIYTDDMLFDRLKQEYANAGGKPIDPPKKPGR